MTIRMQGAREKNLLETDRETSTFFPAVSSNHFLFSGVLLGVTLATSVSLHTHTAAHTLSLRDPRPELVRAPALTFGPRLDVLLVTFIVLASASAVAAVGRVKICVNSLQ